MPEEFKMDLGNLSLSEGWCKSVSVPMLTVLNCTQEKVNETQFGIVPVGSVLSYQCSLIPPDFNIPS